MADYICVAKADEIPAGQGRTVEVEGKKIAVFNIDGNLHAIDDTCVHRGGPLGQGHLEEGVVTCPWHNWRFDWRLRRPGGMLPGQDGRVRSLGERELA